MGKTFFVKIWKRGLSEMTKTHCMKKCGLRMAYILS
jgi:hypothetical protein